MSTLIIGALFVIALVALVGLVFVLRSEPRASRTIPTTPTNSAAHTVAARSEATTSSQPETPTTPRANSMLSASDATPSSKNDGEPRLAMANRQFRELSVELHRLHEEAQEIEHRLSMLSEMIERIQRTQDAHVAEEYSSFGERQSVK